MPVLHPDRLFPGDGETRKIARRLYQTIAKLPIISPHGHTQAEWFAQNGPFPDPARLFIVPDHYVFRMLYSQKKLEMEQLGIGSGGPPDPRALWQIFAENYFLFRGTPTKLWLDFAFADLFGLEEELSGKTASLFYDRIAARLADEDFRPRALYERFNLEVLSTTDSPLDSLSAHQVIRDSGWRGRILPTFRPDSVVDPDFPGFVKNIAELGRLHDEDAKTWDGYLKALRKARLRFRALGGTATDHGHPTANTANLGAAEAAALFREVSGISSATQRELFRGQMLTEMARMSTEDGLVMQLHPGSSRNHNPMLFQRYGRDVGADIPTQTNYVEGLRALLEVFGNDPNFTLIIFTLDESTYGRELAPLAGHYPSVLLGPPWWFFDSPEGMLRFRKAVTETAGFYNTVGFNDDTRAFLSIPTRHDVARRVDSAYLAQLVAEHQLSEDEAADVAYQLTNGLVRKAYRL